MENEQLQINQSSAQNDEATQQNQPIDTQVTSEEQTAPTNSEAKEVEAEEQPPKPSLISRILNVVSWVFLVLTALVMVFTIVSSLTFNRTDKKIFGVSMMIVLSDSMKKTDFAAGDLIFITDVDPKTLKEGDIICFTSQNKENFGETVTHKIKSKTVVEETITDENGQQKTIYIPAFITYGTTTGEEDASPVTYEWIKGKYVGHLPAVGHVFNFLKTPAGYVCIILIPFVLLIGYQIFNAIKAYKLYKGEQKDEIKEERKNLEQERAENLKMLEEMRALKAQLDAMKSQATAPTAPVQTDQTSASEPKQAE